MTHAPLLPATTEEQQTCCAGGRKVTAPRKCRRLEGPRGASRGLSPGVWGAAPTRPAERQRWVLPSIPSTPLPVVRRARGAADPTPPDASPRRAVLGTVPGGKRGAEARGRLEGRPGPGHSVPRGRQACPCPGDTASGVIYGEVPAGFEHGLSPSCSQNEVRVLGSGRARGRAG